VEICILKQPELQNSLKHHK